MKRAQSFQGNEDHEDRGDGPGSPADARENHPGEDGEAAADHFGRRDFQIVDNDAACHDERQKQGSIQRLRAVPASHSSNAAAASHNAK